jgi:hypothetical protein
MLSPYKSCAKWFIFVVFWHYFIVAKNFCSKGDFVALPNLILLQHRATNISISGVNEKIKEAWGKIYMVVQIIKIGF